MASFAPPPTVAALAAEQVWRRSTKRRLAAATVDAFFGARIDTRLTAREIVEDRAGIFDRPVTAKIVVAATKRRARTVAKCGSLLASVALARVKNLYIWSRVFSRGENGNWREKSIAALLLERHGRTLQLNDITGQGSTVRALFRECGSDVSCCPDAHLLRAHGRTLP
jgi:hypothetical protein